MRSDKTNVPINAQLMFGRFGSERFWRGELLLWQLDRSVEGVPDGSCHRSRLLFSECLVIFHGESRSELVAE